MQIPSTNSLVNTLIYNYMAGDQKDATAPEMLSDKSSESASSSLMISPEQTKFFLNIHQAKRLIEASGFGTETIEKRMKRAVDFLKDVDSSPTLFPDHQGVFNVYKELLGSNPDLEPDRLMYFFIRRLGLEDSFLDFAVNYDGLQSEAAFKAEQMEGSSDPNDHAFDQLMLGENYEYTAAQNLDTKISEYIINRTLTYAFKDFDDNPRYFLEKPGADTRDGERTSMLYITEFLESQGHENLLSAFDRAIMKTKFDPFQGLKTIALKLKKNEAAEEFHENKINGDTGPDFAHLDFELLALTDEQKTDILQELGHESMEIAFNEAAFSPNKIEETRKKIWKLILLEL